MSGKRTTFSDTWLSIPQFASWLYSAPNDKYVAGCHACKYTFELSNMGKQALISHMKGQKHKRKMKIIKTSVPIDIFSETKAITNTQSCIQNACVTASYSTASDITEAGSSNTNKMQTFLVSENVTKAEIIWCLHIAVEHMSFRSAARAIETLKMMCTDSTVVEKIQLQRTKIGYMLVHGIAPYFEKELINDLQQADYLVVGFDESLNKISQKQQMDTFVRFFDSKTNEVKSRYLNSVFLGHTCATDLVEAFKSSLTDLNTQKIIQISMDGPNVNFKFLNNLRKEFSPSLDDPVILHLGSCGIHTMHCAFKAALNATNWDLTSYFRSVYYLFKDVPARRADFSAYSGSVTFPKKFCGTRWGENAEVAKRAIEIHPHLLSYISGVKENKKVPTCKSFLIVDEFLKDPLILAKLSFFQMVAEQIEPFVTEFQGEAPMSPFLYESLYSSVYMFLSKFVKSGILREASSVTSIDVTEKSNLKNLKDMEVGYGVRANLKKAKATPCELDKFQKSCQAAYQAFVKKILDRSPIKYKLTRGISSLDPEVIFQKPLTAQKRLKSCLDILVANNWITGNEGDKIDAAYKCIFQKPALMELMKSYNKSNCRLDKFWMDIIESNNLGELKKFVKFILILAHGNAFVERGFSINKDCILENQAEESLIALRQVHDAVTSAGGISASIVTKSLIHRARNAHSYYKETLEKKKKQEALDEEAKKNKKLAESQMKQLQTRKMQLLTDTEKKIALIDEEIKSLKK